MNKLMKALPLSLLFVFFAGEQATAGPDFRSELSGAQEVTGGGSEDEVEAPGVDTGTTGFATVRFESELDALQYRVVVRDGIAITQAHLHCAPAGENGPVLVFLFPGGPDEVDPTGKDVNGTLVNGTLTNGNIRPSPCEPAINNIASLLTAIRRDEVYVNVHSAANPGGEVRGQILFEE